jgi:hypothetical protein
MYNLNKICVWLFDNQNKKLPTSTGLDHCFLTFSRFFMRIVESTISLLALGLPEKGWVCQKFLRIS